MLQHTQYTTIMVTLLLGLWSGPVSGAVVMVDIILAAIWRHLLLPSCGQRSDVSMLLRSMLLRSMLLRNVLLLVVLLLRSMLLRYVLLLVVLLLGNMLLVLLLMGYMLLRHMLLSVIALLVRNLLLGVHGRTRDTAG
jgi:hypothetical protein